MSHSITVPFHRPIIGEGDVKWVTDVLRGGWLTMGERVAQFEDRIATITETDRVVAVNSCTAALHLSLIALGIGHGDEVIVPALTFASTANVVEHVGATPVLVDVQDDTGNIDPDRMAEAITPRTKAVIPVHYAGHPCEMDTIARIANDHTITIIEDAAHAIGANYRGKPIGSISPMTCFSFYATKNLTTGEGGAVAVNGNDEIADRIAKLRLHGLSRDAWKRYGSGGSWRYDIEECGWKYNMTDINAALGLSQLLRFGEFQRHRDEIAATYTRRLGECDGVRLPIVRQGCRSAHHLYPIRVRADRRDRFIDEMTRRGVGCSVHFIPIHHHSYYMRAYGYRTGGFPNAERWGDTEVSIPLFPGMTGTEIDAVVGAVVEADRATRR